MKRSAPPILFMILILGLSSCASLRGMADPSSVARRIKEITVTGEEEHTDIHIKTEWIRGDDPFVEEDRPIVYTAFRLTDPPRFVVDLFDVSVGRHQERITVNNMPVRAVVPREGEGSDQPTRIEVEIDPRAEPSVRLDGRDLHIEVTRSPQELPPASPERRATVLTAVEVEKTDGFVKVIFIADGRMVPEHSFHGEKQVVVDLPGVTHSVKNKIIPVNNQIIKEVRITDRQKPLSGTKVILDLIRKVPYKLEEGGTQLVMLFAEDPPPDAVKASRASRPVSTGEGPSQGLPIASPSSSASGGPSPVKNEREMRPEGQKEGEILPKKFTGKRISLDFQDAELSSVIKQIAEVSRLNIVLGEDAKGKITIRLVNVPWDQALDVILKMHGLGQVREEDVIRIATLANLAKQQEEEARAKSSLIQAEDLVTKIIQLNYSKAKDLAEPLKKGLSPRGDITVDERTNGLIVRDVERNILRVMEMVKILDTRTPQVQIEARIVQVQPEFNRSLGIQWGATMRKTSGTNVVSVGGQTGAFPKTFNPAPTPLVFGPTPDFVVNLPGAIPQVSPIPSLGFTFGRLTEDPVNLDLRLSAGEFQGLTKIISTPRVTVLDNQQAIIKQGETIPFQAFSPQTGPQTIFVDAALTLDVTPHITADGNIIMKVIVSKDAPGATLSSAGPNITKKRAETSTLIKDGETVVIGGIIETTETDSTQGVPFLSRIPVLGWLFKRVDTKKDTKELLVFLTPTIIR